MEQPGFILQTSNGEYIIVGRASSNDGDVSGNHGGYDVWIIRIDSAGNLIWQNCYGGSGDEFGRSLIETADSGFVLIAETNSNDGDVSGNHGGTDFWVVKLSHTGSIDWQKCFGGQHGELPLSLATTPDGGYIVVGRTHSENTGDVTGYHGQEDCWVIKLDRAGNLEWQRCIGGSDFDSGHSVYVTSDGGYILGGGTHSNDGDVTGNHGIGDCWLVKVDSTGDVVWQKCYGGSESDYFYSVIRTLDGGYMGCGSTSSSDGDVIGNNGDTDYWLVKMDATGMLQWQKCLGGSSLDISGFVSQTDEGSLIVSGWSTSNDGDVSGNHGSYDFWILKLDATGNIAWQKCLGDSLLDIATTATVSMNSVIVCGLSNSNNGEVIGNHGGNDFWVVKLYPDTAGCDASIGSDTLNSNTLSASVGISYQWINCANGQYISGATNQTFAAGAGVYAVQVANAMGCNSISDCFENIISNITPLTCKPMLIHPNPSTGVVHFNLNGLSGTLIIQDAIGQFVEQSKVRNFYTSVALPTGLLTWKFVSIEGQMMSGKVLVMR